MNKESICADDLNIINKYSDMVYRLAYSLVKNKYDADDIHQEVFIQYIKTHPYLENHNHEKAWFLRATIHRAKNLWKSAWWKKVITMEKCHEEENIEVIGENEKLIAAVKSIPQKYRIVIHLFYYEELSINEISELLNIKPSTVRTQLTRARRLLKELLKEDIFDV